ncbi:ribosome-recycling factor, mitochondrial-like isoform X2 [Ostrea edulis]|uniref:ribosome-recycling factor, mitochondrial-like isoform X2 n=1 Tax=Ostrea edulis TaxID=37623 RepID=UPI00209595B1|nr:ribosome-recycling factor, mitochondrial-like isoform X2 [Ostrea edulis]
MSRFVCLCRTLPTCAARTMPVSRKLCPLAAVSSVRLTAPLIQLDTTCWVDNRAFSLSTQCMKKGNTKAKKQMKRKSKVASIEEEDEVEPEVEKLVNIEELSEEMENALGHMQKEFIKSVSLRPSAAQYENLSIETPHGKFPLNQIAQVAIQGPVVIINMAVSPQYVKDVDDALRKGLNVNPQIDGTTLTLPVPNGLVVRLSDSQPKGHGFESWPRQGRRFVFGKGTLHEFPHSTQV